MADDYGDKTEAPTPRKRQEAREQGKIARSQDLSAALLLLGGLVLLDWTGPGMIDAMRSLVAEMLSHDSLRGTTTAGLMAVVMRSLTALAMAVVPLMMGVVVIGVVANVAQVGLVFNFARLTPKLNSLNPASGIKRIFGQGQAGVSLLMNIAKLTLCIGAGYSAVHHRLPAIVAAPQMPYIAIVELAIGTVYDIGIRIAAILLILAIIDYAWQRYRNERDLKMTKQEVKEEMKRMEGDPHIKARRRQIAIANLRNRIKSDVPTADVVVTNPTEYAVAIKYDSKTMHAPRVVAKGRGPTALLIRQVAIANGVPILERKPLARALYKMVEIGGEIPEQFYSAVAEILAYVYELTGKLRRRAG